MKDAKLYALLVGINDYPEPVPPLSCCENDVTEMERYLNQETGQFKELHIKKLVNNAATKTAIVDGFLNHLTKAGEKDTALFFFSGHGTQEETDPEIWPFETDNKLECLVGVDGIVNTEGGLRYNLLADKELRYLIRQVALKKPHIVTVFDCCHSGGMTRNSSIQEALETARERRVITSRFTSDSPTREWSQFIFSDKVDPKDLATKPLDEVIPKGDHIRLSACQADQSAYEIGGSGIFTKNLLEILQRSEGAVNYYDLHSRIKYYIKNQFDQVPQVLADAEDSSVLFKAFLGKDLSAKPLMANIQYNEMIGWVMDMGAMHGVSYEAETVKILDDSGAEIGDAAIDKIEDSFTLLLPEVELKAGSYKGYLSRFLTSPIVIYLQNEQDGTSNMELFKEKLKEAGKNLHLTEKRHEADYVLRITDHSYQIQQPDEQARPVVQSVKISSEESAETVVVFLNYISQWEFVKSLESPKRISFEGHPVHVELSQYFGDGSSKNIDLTNDLIPLEYEKLEGGGWSGRIKIKLTNAFPQPLYVSFIFLSELFQVYPKLLGDYVIKIDHGESVFALDGREIKLKLPDFIKQFNWPECVTYFKVIASTQPFETALFEQAPLPAPGTRSSEGAKGLKLKKNKKSSAHGWTTRLLTMRIKNPLYEEQ